MQTATNTVVPNTPVSTNWSAVGSMAMCVALLIAAEFMPVSLLTPIASDLHASVGMAGQAISISGLFAVVTSMYIATFAARYDRRYVLIGLTAIMLLSLVLIALAPSFFILMVARALLGVVIGGFPAVVCLCGRERIKTPSSRMTRVEFHQLRRRWNCDHSQRIDPDKRSCRHQ